MRDNENHSHNWVKSLKKGYNSSIYGGCRGDYGEVKPLVLLRLGR